MDVAAITRDIAEGRPLAALDVLAPHVVAQPGDESAFRAAVTALFTAAQAPAALAGWDHAARPALFAALIRQEDCDAEPLILAHEAASHITSGNAAATQGVMTALEPILRQMVAAPDAVSARGFKNAVVLLATARSAVGAWLAQDDISRLHVAHFAAFTPADLGLPYSVMFNPGTFGRNRDDVLQGVWKGTSPMDWPAWDWPHLVLYEWLTGGSAFARHGEAGLAQALANRPPTTAAARAAARSLMLRHGHAGSGDVAEGLEAAVAQVTRRRAALPPGNAQASAARLAARPVQAGAALRNLAAQALPALQRTRRPRVAICLSGQLRGYTAALATWRKHLLPHIDATFYVHSWQGIGRSDAQPFRYVLPFAGTHFAQTYREIAVAQGYAAMQARYPSLFAALRDGAIVTEDTLRAAYETDHVVLEDDQDARFAAFSNQQKMHYKIHAADSLARAAGTHDLMIRLRPDLPVALSAVPWGDIAATCARAPLLLAEKPYGVHYQSLMIGDQFAMAHPSVMQTYASTWEDFPLYAAAGLAGCPEVFTGHVSLAMCCWLAGVHVAKVPMRFGTLQDAAPLATPAILAALEADGGQAEQDVRLRDAAARDVAEARA